MYLNACILFFLALTVTAQDNVPPKQYATGTDLLRAMHVKYKDGPCKSYAFSQKNTHYKGDSISGHSLWYEAVEFPDKFRIHFGEKSAGNYVVFKNDSAYNYKAGKLVKQRRDENSLLLVLGGMYYRTFEDVLQRLEKAGYNVKVLSSDYWKNKPVYVIGAQKGDSLTNQIWVDQTTLRVLRVIEKLNGKDVMDMRFEAHQDWCKGYVETKVSFRKNGVLEQVEEYYDIKETKGFTEWGVQRRQKHQEI